MPTPSVSVKPKAYLKARHKQVRQALEELKLDALMLTHPEDITYLTNFTGEDSIALLSQSEFVLVTDFRYREQVEIEAAWLDVVIREGKMSDALAKAVLGLKPTGGKSAAKGPFRVGFEANFTTFGQVHAVDRSIVNPPESDAAKDNGKATKSSNGSTHSSGLAGGPNSAGVEFVPLENVMVNLRKVKDDHEIGLIRKSVEVAEEAFQAIRDQIKPGQTENYLAGLLGFELRCRGASDSSFPIIVATGSNSSLPHYRPKETLVQKDQPLLFDWGARMGGYCSDLTRTLLMGRVSPKMREIYKVVLDAQLAAIAYLRPGVTTVNADKVARDLIDRAGYGEFFGHSLGHGIGRDIHELPGLRKTGPEEELRPGMIVTVEPGIYLPGEGGVRIEDDVLITHSGCEVLSSLPKRLEDCQIS